MAGNAEPRILVGAIAGAHGVRGQVRIKSFTAEPADVAAYGPVSDESGARRFTLAVIGPAKGGVIARIDGIGDRNAAEALKGMRLYVPRAALPEPEEEAFYHADLIGLAVDLADGSRFGRVVAVQNYGAGDVLEIQPASGGTTIVAPFTRAVVPLVDIAGRRILLDPPSGLLEPAGRPEEAE
ncbi:ribosome maturation factor RimM [Rhodospirillaceae bacterium SYSU D60014]|uniref:ribosome maturation factor RimM n=1 Tax=Virgifigura deserti TaxID=2268457 RepID=UPI000E66657A